MNRLCVLRDVYRAIAQFELKFQDGHGLCFNQGMLLCTLMDNDRPMASGELAELMGLTASNTSKVIKSVEKLGYIERILGDKDKRQMYFMLTESGKDKVNGLDCDESQLPELLRSIIKMIYGD